MKKFLCVLSMLFTALFMGAFVGCSLPIFGGEETLIHITANYEQSSLVYEHTQLESLRNDLTVTVETTKETVATEDYTLSGALVVGESEITVTYTLEPAFTATFTVVVSEHTHEFTTYVDDNNAKCGIDGTKSALCDNGCGVKDVIVAEGTALSHVYTNYTSDGNATCQADGTKSAVCDNGCGSKDTVTDLGSVVDHVFENYVFNDDAECEQDGTKTGACKFGCGEAKTVVAEGSALGHTFVLSECVRCPETNYLTIITNPTPAKTYYGFNPTFSSGLVKNALGETVTDGTWLLSDFDYLASATQKSIDTTATATFSSNSMEYAPVSVHVNIVLYAVAEYDSTYFATVDGALERANKDGAGTVEVLPLGSDTDNGKAKIAKTISVVSEIKSGVTLSLPYEENGTDLDSYVFVTDSSEYKTSAYNKNKFIKNQVFIAEGHTITNAGEINIAGEISGGASMNYSLDPSYANSITAGQHARVNLGDNAKLISTGTVNCYGFISEENRNNGSEFIVEEGSVKVMFTIVEYRGGSVYFGMINPENPKVNSAIASAAISGLTGNGKYTPDTLQTSPINRFYIESVTAKTTVKHGAKMVGHAVLFAEGENHQTTVNLINGTDGIINLEKEGGSVTYKYDYTTHKTDLDVYGDMTLNPLKLQLTITKSQSSLTTTITITLTTGKTGDSTGVFFPISDYFDISLNAFDGSATVNALNQKVKLLPGAKLVIGEGVTVNANEIAVYANNNLFKNGTDTHYDTNKPAELVVYGALNVHAIGGTVKVGGDNAKLTINEAASVISKEISSTESGKSTTINLTLASATLPYTGVTHSSVSDSTLTANGATINGEALGVNEYCVKDGKWCPVNVNVTFVLNGGTASETSKQFAYGYEFTESDLVVAERNHYEFLGWYTTQYYTNGTEFTAMTLTKDVVLYAKWQQVQGVILVEFKAAGSNIIDMEKTSSFTVQELDSTTNKAVIPAQASTWNNDLSYGRYVVGYYADAECTTEFDFSQSITESTTIYVKWADKVCVTIASSVNKVTAGGVTVSATTFYVVSGTEIKVTAKKSGLGPSITITESYGGKTATGSGLFSAEATLTFAASGNTTVTVG